MNKQVNLNQDQLKSIIAECVQQAGGNKAVEKYVTETVIKRLNEEHPKQTFKLEQKSTGRKFNVKAQNLQEAKQKLLEYLTPYQMMQRRDVAFFAWAEDYSEKAIKLYWGKDNRRYEFLAKSVIKDMSTEPGDETDIYPDNPNIIYRFIKVPYWVWYKLKGQYEQIRDTTLIS